MRAENRCHHSKLAAFSQVRRTCFVSGEAGVSGIRWKVVPQVNKGSVKMAFNQLTTRVVFAGAFALALTVAPAVAVFSSPAAAPAPRTLADSTSDGCTGGESMDAYSLACVPDIVPNVPTGAPGEMQLTQDNPGIASPGSHGGR
jgi:hypothetical protein